MAEGEKPLCKYGASCYRKNKEHLRQYAHQKEMEQEEEEKLREVAHVSPPPAKKARIEMGMKKTGETNGSKTCTLKEEEGKVETEAEDSTRSAVISKFLVSMPDDFYQFWDLCFTLNPSYPHLALKDSLGLELVGPYHVLAGKLRNVPTEKCLLHYRYFYDPPELLTVLSGTDKNEGYHIGYYRDDPNTTDCFLVCATTSSDYVLKPFGVNVFSAVRFHIHQKLQLKSLSARRKQILCSLDKQVSSHANQLGLDLTRKKPQGRRPVTACLHTVGICVPVDKILDVGYRPLPMSNRELIKLLDKIASLSKSSSQRKQASDFLQETITLVQFANDECDYGMGLELGIDLFCHGDQHHDAVSHLLPLAYELLGREQYGKIITEHLKNRQRLPLDFSA